MTNRKILYGYQIQNGELVAQEQETVIVNRITTLYIEGLSYQKIADILNSEAIPYSSKDRPWNKHKVKRLLENPRYTGIDGYPVIIDSEIFQTIQRKIRSKTENYSKTQRRPALLLKNHLQCDCGGSLHRIAGTTRKKNTLYLKCGACGKQFTVLDSDLLSEVSRQMAKHDTSTKNNYVPSSEVIRLANAVNRQLEHPAHPEDTVSLILQGISARYDCCPNPIASDTFIRPAEVDFKSFGQVVSHITISDGTITVHFK